MSSKKLASVDAGRCAACGACANECRKNAISVWKGCFSVVNGALCIGCGLCAAVCPADCITIILREEAAV